MRGKTCFTVKDGRDGLDSRRVQENGEVARIRTVCHVSEQAGGLPSLTAALVILTGVIGAVVVTPLMNALRIRDYAARGFAAGLASHGIGTARAFTVDPVAGVFAGVAMGLNAVATPIMVPLILPWLIG